MVARAIRRILSRSAFGTVGAETWRLKDSQALSRMRRLVPGAPFEQIVAMISCEMTLLKISREQLKSDHRYYRASITLRVKPRAVDLFHNCASGYRAQYYISTGNGERANRYALSTLTGRVIELLNHSPKRTCSPDWVAQSISDPNAKLWIHQGQWLRHAGFSDAILLVSRWLKRMNSADLKHRKKVRWSALAPDAENRIDVKGAYLTLHGEPFGPTKPDRARDIHELGF